LYVPAQKGKLRSMQAICRVSDVLLMYQLGDAYTLAQPGTRPQTRYKIQCYSFIVLPAPLNPEANLHPFLNRVHPKRLISKFWLK
jgi:hypothetical protein